MSYLTMWFWGHIVVPIVVLWSQFWPISLNREGKGLVLLNNIEGSHNYVTVFP